MPERPTAQVTTNEPPIPEGARRLSAEDSFRFACHQGVGCFGDCCGDVNIVLMPYDVLRLKNRLGLSSGEFLSRYTVMPFSKEQRLPVPLIRMGDDEKKSCPFLDEKGCSVYEDRPWACRMYPLGLAAPKDGDAATAERSFYFLLDEKGCRGFAEDREQTVAEWIEDQGLIEYEAMGDAYRQLAVDDYLASDVDLEPRQMQMLFMGTYDLDSFRRFVFTSSFLNRFEVSEEEIEAIRESDEELLEFGLRWLRFCLFQRPTMKIAKKAQ